MRALIGWFAAAALGSAPGAAAWTLAQTGEAAPGAIGPYAVQLGVAGVFLWFCLRLQGDLKADRKAHDEAMATVRAAHAKELVDERVANRDALRAEREAHLTAMRAERDAHMAEMARERGEATKLYDRVVDKVVPTMEATIHMANEVRDDLRRMLVDRAGRVEDSGNDRQRGGYNQGHGRQRGS